MQPETTQRPKHRKEAEEEAARPLTEEEEVTRERARDKKSKARKLAELENVEVEVSESSADEDEQTVDPAKLKRKLRLAREKKRCVGYRAKAAECGYAPGSLSSAAGKDQFAHLISLSEAKRLVQWSPENVKAGSFERSELADRLRLSSESIPQKVGVIVQQKAESLFRNVLNEAVLRTVEKGAMRIDAATVYSILRPYAQNFDFTFASVPTGLLRDAQSKGILSATSEDADAADAEKEENKQSHALLKKLAAVEAEEKEARREKREAAKAEKAAEAASVKVD